MCRIINSYCYADFFAGEEEQPETSGHTRI